MRIKISDNGFPVLIFVDEVRTAEEGGAIVLPKLGKAIMTGGLTSKLFGDLLKNGWADLSEFNIKPYSQEVLL